VIPVTGRYALACIEAGRRAGRCRSCASPASSTGSTHRRSR